MAIICFSHLAQTFAPRKFSELERTKGIRLFRIMVLNQSCVWRMMAPTWAQDPPAELKTWFERHNFGQNMLALPADSESNVFRCHLLALKASQCADDDMIWTCKVVADNPGDAAPATSLDVCKFMRASPAWTLQKIEERCTPGLGDDQVHADQDEFFHIINGCSITELELTALATALPPELLAQGVDARTNPQLRCGPVVCTFFTKKIVARELKALQERFLLEVVESEREQAAANRRTAGMRAFVPFVIGALQDAADDD